MDQTTGRTLFRKGNGPSQTLCVLSTHAHCRYHRCCRCCNKSHSFIAVGAVVYVVKDDPTAGIMDLMKDMYDNGDDQMRKTIGESLLKSQQERMGGL